MPGGEDTSHPLRPGTLEELAALGGPEFDDISGTPTPGLDLEPYTPQIRYRRSMRGYLHEGTYFIRAAEVIRKDGVVSSKELRRELGFKPSQKIVVLFFDDDEILEEVWGRGPDLLSQLAAAKFDAVITPSFSLYTPRSRTEHLINLRRSMLIYGAMLASGIAAIPRVGWIVSHDVRRLAEWFNRNPAVRIAGLDLQTCDVAKDWRAEMEGLELFDRLTGRRIKVIINGASTQDRCEEVLSILGPDRAVITNATTQAQIPKRTIRSLGDQTGVTFAARLAVRRSVVNRALEGFAAQGQRAA